MIHIHLPIIQFRKTNKTPPSISDTIDYKSQSSQLEWPGYQNLITRHEMRSEITRPALHLWIKDKKQHTTVGTCTCPDHRPAPWCYSVIAARGFRWANYFFIAPSVRWIWEQFVLNWWVGVASIENETRGVRWRREITHASDSLHVMWPLNEGGPFIIVDPQSNTSATGSSRFSWSRRPNAQTWSTSMALLLRRQRSSLAMRWLWWSNRQVMRYVCCLVLLSLQLIFNMLFTSKCLKLVNWFIQTMIS